MNLDDARLRVERAKDTYTHAIRQIDRNLRPLVAADPSTLDAAREVQASFTAIDFTPEPLTDPNAVAADSPAS
jgi:hypothetical protein